ncbi:hypothetical protein Trydic_g15259 [Trypoxylus dichotomus]
MLEFQTFILNFVISGSAAIISKTLLAPIERAKLILQTQTSAYQIITGQTRPYTGLLDLFCRVPKEQGIWSLWRGNGVNVIRYFPSQALNFAFYDVFKGMFDKYSCSSTYAKNTLSKITAGGLAGGFSTAIVFPLHFCQTRLSVDMGKDVEKDSKMSPTSNLDRNRKCYRRDIHSNSIPREFYGLCSCIKVVWNKNGLEGLYRGVLISVIGIAVYRGFYFGLFDLTKQLYRQNPQEPKDNVCKPPTIVLFVMAQIVTSAAGFLAYPLDTVSRHMMMDSGRDAHLQRCQTVHSTMKHILRSLGWTGFYKGALTNVLRCTAGALVLVLYDEFLYYTNWKEKLRKFSK